MSDAAHNEPIVDGHGRPYFLWDMDMTLDQFEKCLSDGDPAVSGYFHAKLMRQARPEDVFRFARPRRIRELWSNIEPHLGDSRDFWRWLFEKWEGDGRGWK